MDSVGGTPADAAATTALPNNRLNRASLQTLNSPEAGKCEILEAMGGRTGFDLKNALEAACRGRFVGLVKNRTKNKC